MKGARTSPIARIAVIALVLCSTWMLAACDATSDDVVSLRDPGDGVAAATEEPLDRLAENEAKMMAFAACLREEGLDVEDPQLLASGDFTRPSFREGEEPADWNEVKDAYATCQHHLEGYVQEKSKEDVSDTVDQYVELAACLREKGHDIDNPTAETLEQWENDFRQTLDWNDPATVNDYNECAGNSDEGSKKQP
jgi:hypothetical protein